VKAAHLLSRATIVFHDSLVSREILRLIARGAEVIDVGKRCGKKLLTQEEINALLVAAPASHEIVIRLKGGDPLIFGRAGEEIEALRNSGVDFEVVISTFSHGTDASTDWSSITSTTTLALYMPGPDYGEVAHRLLEAGLPDDLPCVIVSNATTPQQQIRWSALSRLSREEQLPAPALLIIGRVAAQRAQEISRSSWRDARKYSQPRPVVS
jgi:siroheme synthase